MLGKRARRTMRRTSSVQSIGSGYASGESPLPEHPKERQKFCDYKPVCGTVRQVIGFHPKANDVVELDVPPPISPRRAEQSGKTHSASPRSGLGDLLAGSRPWERKDEGVGLGIVASLSGSQEDIRKAPEDARGFNVPVGAEKVTVQPNCECLLGAASPAIPIRYPTSVSAYQSAALHRPRANCYPGATGFGVVSDNAVYLLHPVHAPCNTAPVWSNPGSLVGSASSRAQQQSYMEVERQVPAPGSSSTPSRAYQHNFLDSCHLCGKSITGMDIYMYRGSIPFCSPECRQQQLTNDERPRKGSSVTTRNGGSDVRSSALRRTGTAAAA